MNSLKSRRTALLSLVLFSSFLLVIPSIFQAAKINVWTLDYFQLIYKGKQQEPAPDHPRGELWQALSALSAQDWQAAIELSSPLAVQGNKYAIELQGRAFEGAGDYSAAFQAYRHVGNSQGLLRVAATTSELGDVNIARVAYYAAWEIDPRNTTEKLVKFLVDNGDNIGAEEIIRRSLDSAHLGRVRPYVLVQLAGILESQNRWSESLEIHAQVIDESYLFYPGERHLARRYTDLAWAYHMINQHPMAVDAIQNAITQLPSDPSSYVHVWLQAGQIYENSGKTKLALQAYQKVLEQEPDYKNALDAVLRLTTSDKD